MNEIIGLIDVNYWAVLVSGVVAMVLGAVWYNVFSEPWLEGVGLSKTRVNQGSKFVYLWSFLAMLVIAYVLSYVVVVFVADSIWEGLEAGVLAWLGFSATTVAINYMYQQKSLKLFAIDSGYLLFVFALSGAILAAWPA